MKAKAICIKDRKGTDLKQMHIYDIEKYWYMSGYIAWYYMPSFEEYLFGNPEDSKFMRTPNHITEDYFNNYFKLIPNKSRLKETFYKFWSKILRKEV